MDARERWLLALLLTAGCAGSPRPDPPSDVAPLPATVPDQGAFEDRVRDALRRFRGGGDAEPAGDLAEHGPASRLGTGAKSR